MVIIVGFESNGDEKKRAPSHLGWDKKRDDDGFCAISCFLLKASTHYFPRALLKGDSDLLKL